MTDPTTGPTRLTALWAYCVAAADADLDTTARPVHPEGGLELVEAGRVAALVSRVPLSVFGEEPLRRHLNDLPWLERVARVHEGVLERALARATIVPLRLCTIYADEEGVRRMLAEEHLVLESALELLQGRQEWAVKLLVDPAALEAAARERIGEPEPSGEEVVDGRAYLARRRSERRVRAAADDLATDLADDVHERVAALAQDSVLNRPQNRELSGHEGEMLLNGAYLLDADDVGALHDLAAGLDRAYEGFGARIEVAGPWPPYNFVPSGESSLGVTS